jgi:Dynamin family
MDLCDRLRGVCDAALAGLPPGPARDIVAAVRARLAEDVLRVAVGGRMNSGKSTLVNALLGEHLAATDATECTTLVTWFRYGPVNLVRLRFTDGAERSLIAQPLASAVAAAGRPAADISAVEVESSNEILRRAYTIVDTPGLDSLSGLDALSLSALSQADVLIYLMPHPGQNDVETLSALRATAGEAGITAVNTIGVLSRIDVLGEGTGDPWPRARRQADKDARRLGALVGAIVPVHGLLAQTALGTAFGETDMGLLRQVSGADPGDVEAACYSADDFLSHPALPLARENRERLLSLLGLYGIGVALAEVAGGVQGAAGLLKALRASSGIDDLLERLNRQFLTLADPLRARTAMHALDAVSWQGSASAEIATLTGLRGELDALRGHPRLRQLDLASTLADRNAGKWAASEEATEELVALATGADPAAQLRLQPGADTDAFRSALAARISAWRATENTSGRAAARHARVVREYLESLYSALPGRASE